MLANMLAISNALDLPATIVAGFVDSKINRLLDLDAKREVAFSMTAIGWTQAAVPAASGEPPTLDLPVARGSRNEIEYPLLGDIHASSSLSTDAEAAAWRRPTPGTGPPGTEKPLIALRALDDAELPRDPIEQVILRRGSTRRFSREAISFEKFSTILDRATRGIPADFLDPAGAQINDLYIIVNAVDGLSSGAYFFHRGRRALEVLKEGDFRSEARYLGLGQALPGDASAAIFFMADLHTVLEVYGNRGYRAAQLEAGILGGKVYLAAYALRLGATGLTFFDDDVTQFFSPHAAGKSAVFLVAVGRGVRPAA
jgi:SagB-type dehydrogenase family enzyme